jgi:hypothetical protein
MQLGYENFCGIVNLALSKSGSEGALRPNQADSYLNASVPYDIVNARGRDRNCRNHHKPMQSGPSVWWTHDAVIRLC